MKTQLSLGVLTSLLLTGVASSQTVDFPNSKDSHWSGNNFFLDTAAGTFDLGNQISPIGYAYNNQETVRPPNVLDERYNITGSFLLRSGSVFGHGFFDESQATPGSGMYEHGFGVAFVNDQTRDPSDQLLLISNNAPSDRLVSLVPNDFMFPKVDLASTASVSYNLTFQRTSISLSGRDDWNLFGTVDAVVTPGGPTSRFLVDHDFLMDFEGTDFGLQLQNLPGGGGGPSTAVSGISSLQWSVTTVPEPSGVLLLSLGAFGAFLRRKR